MANMGEYCKAYLITDLRAYSGWVEKIGHRDGDQQPQDGERQPFPDDHYLFVQENYVVTDGIFIDEHVVFDDDSPAWRQFCTDVLKFEIPKYELPPLVDAEPEAAPVA
jgi:hypothetical protein